MQQVKIRPRALYTDSLIRQLGFTQEERDEAVGQSLLKTVEFSGQTVYRGQGVLDWIVTRGWQVVGEELVPGLIDAKGRL